MKILNKFLYFICAPFFALSFVLLPLTNDARIYLGVARLTDYFGTFPQNIDAAWEIKPIGNRLINYILYHIAAPFGDTLFPYVVRIAVLLLIIGVSWYAAKQLRGEYTGLLIFFAFTTCANFCMLQAEYFAVLLAVLCLAMIVSSNPLHTVVAGPVMLMVFLCKGITGFLVFPILAAVMLLAYNWQEKGRLFIVAAILSLAWYFTLCLTVFPNSIADMLLSKSLARVGLYPFLTTLDLMIYAGGIIYIYIPAILIGVVVLAYLVWKKDWIVRGAMIALWGIPIIMIFAQGEFFVYHYLLLVFPAIVSIVYYERIT